MIIGQDSAKKGFLWYFILLLKLFAGVATIAWWGSYPFIGVIGVLATVLFIYEQVRGFKTLSD
jgi:asparagine N-glycosylation enzyme membrane subunit Stt3